MAQCFGKTLVFKGIWALNQEQWIKKVSLHKAKCLLEFTGKTWSESLDFPEKRGTKNTLFPEAFPMSCMGGRGSREGERERGDKERKSWEKSSED